MEWRMKKIFMTIGLYMIIQLNISAFSGIVFWEYNENDSYNEIIKKNYIELLKNKPQSVFLSFEKCSEYDSKKIEFYFPETEILNPEIDLTEWDIGNRYFSIVINNEMIITGLNRVGYFGAKMLREDCFDGTYICWVGLDIKRFKLTKSYVASFNGLLNQEADRRKIKTKKIDEYFRRKESSDK